jgi:2',3'-cyclic-nucleotide 2'-phosphodiesterase (5'-nucleotidase family)
MVRLLQRPLRLTVAMLFTLTLVLVTLPQGAESKPQSTIEMQILGLNETHGQLVPLSSGDTQLGGAGALATYLEQEEAENPNTLILDSGDFMQGPPISSFSEGECTVDVFNEIGVDAVAVGNHEFDWGQDTLQERIAQADFPLLANNIVEEATGETPEYLAPYEVFNLEGVNVGVIGVGNPDTENVSLPSNIEGLSFYNPEQTAETLEESVAELQRQGVETIVVTAHMGLVSETEGPLADMLNLLSDETAEAIDFVLAGHIPLEFSTEINGIPVIQPLGNTRGYADVTLTIDQDTGDVVHFEAETDTVETQDVKADPKVRKIVKRCAREVQQVLGEVVGEAASPITRGAGETEMGNFVTDAMRDYALHFDPGVDFAFTHSGGMRADIDQGPITLEEIYTVLPFNNTIVLMDLTGAQVIQVLEEGAGHPRYGTVQVSGLEWTYNASALFGSRVTSVTLPDGTPIDPNATYTIATNNFMAEGGDQFTTLTQGTNVVDTQFNLVDAVVHYLELNSPVDPLVEGRLTICQGCSNKLQP